jgi:hypothetical protein
MARMGLLAVVGKLLEEQEGDVCARGFARGPRR